MYQDKKILVVGMGNSAADIAVELSRVGEQVSHEVDGGRHRYRCKNDYIDRAMGKGKSVQTAYIHGDRYGRKRVSR